MTPSGLGVDVLGAEVVVDGEDAGRVTGVLVHAAAGPIGLEVTAADFARRFLPFVAATVIDGVVEVPSPLLLVECCDAYVQRGAWTCRDAVSLEKALGTVRASVSGAAVAGRDST